MRDWLSIARVFGRDKNMRGENFPGRFEDWMHRECGMKNTQFTIIKIFAS